MNRVGEAKRRKQILGDTYGTPATITQTIQIAKKKNDALLPSGFLPDFGLEVSAQIGEEPFHLTALELKDLKVLEDAKKSRLAINFIPLQFSITSISADVNPPMILRETMVSLEIYTSEQSKIDAVIEALSEGIDVKANWSKRFFTAHPVHKELVVPIHLLPYEEDRLGLQHIADYI
jgi:hypothetical protein